MRLLLSCGSSLVDASDLHSVNCEFCGQIGDDASLDVRAEGVEVNDLIAVKLEGETNADVLHCFVVSTWFLFAWLLRVAMLHTDAGS